VFNRISLIPVKHIPRKRFGQHFLTDDGIIHAIVNAINPKPGEVLVEIGPGLGALTRPLLDRIPHLHVVELDRDIIARLKKTWAPERLTIHEGDALKFDFGSLVIPPLVEASEPCPPLPLGEGRGEGATPDQPAWIASSASPPRNAVIARAESPWQSSQISNTEKIRICGNLPYNISSPLLFHLMDYADRISDMTFMLQKEVVDRMVAAPSTPAYGRLSVMLQRRFHMEALFDVPPEAFDPPPKVESAIVRMIPKSGGEIIALDEKLFGEIVAAAFSQRRKTLRNTLAGKLKTEEFAKLGIDAGLRAENLGVADYEIITKYLTSKNGSS
jgi:16S rRNA (adenine1518-N6/adenine1519-N6)-dimethyltransferase